MKINKSELHNAISNELTKLLDNTTKAALQAHETATHEENKAENKYDTLGLEAAYLAEGQARRVAELEKQCHAFDQLKATHFDANTKIAIGALVCLRTENNDTKYVFLSPVAGGVELIFNDIKIMLITASSPLGKALKKCVSGDDIELKQQEHTMYYEILHVW